MQQVSHNSNNNSNNNNNNNSSTIEEISGPNRNGGYLVSISSTFYEQLWRHSSYADLTGALCNIVMIVSTNWSAYLYPVL